MGSVKVVCFKAPLLARLEKLTSEIDGFEPNTFAVTIPVREIVHAYMFDMEHYSEFNNEQDADQPTPELAEA